MEMYLWGSLAHRGSLKQKYEWEGPERVCGVGEQGAEGQPWRGVVVAGRAEEDGLWSRLETIREI